MPPPDFVAASMPVSQDPSHPNPQSIPSLVSEQGENEAPFGESQAMLIEDRNNWPDVDCIQESIPPREAATLGVPDSDAWVDPGEVSSFCGSLSDEDAQCYMVDVDIRTRLITALEKESSVKDGLLPPDGTKFPNPRTLRHFLQLFFEYMQPRFPILHQPTFSTATAPPFLLLAMMLLGSSHSPTNHGRFVAVYIGSVVTMFSRMQALDTAFLRETNNILTLLFLCVSSAWCGHKSAFEFAEGARGILVTACRRCRLLDCRLKPSNDGDGAVSQRAKLHQSWQSWIRMEQRKRLGLSIHTFDLQFPALFHNQPYISKSETVNLVLPCPDTFWEAKSAAAWKVLLGPAEIPPSTYFMVPLDTCLLYPATKWDPPYAPIDSFSKTILMYALFTHIFEWRQSVNIVQHSAFIRGPEGTEMGEGLVERQEWLRDGLDAWISTYHQSGDSAPDAALLLHFLAQIHLDINVSDLHLYAGRSGLSEDIKLAKDSLRSWCRSPGSERTMHNVYGMLNLAYQIIERRSEHQCGFEISVALFTGGLTCWVYEKLGGQVPVGFQINLASDALEKLTCWGICSNFAQILKRFTK
ncbi:fungal-specific transcription factor domain-containing protein [Aspergillus granulosus]|uniref:Fungal-specific transcription factor domain-containing protein n=1 Tax=Aspergillus granulosus TaxID=176169 RepID=A0ABR4H4J7_9EURO